MARDYAKRPNKKGPRKPASRKQGKIAPWTWLLTGLLLGLVVGAVAYLKLNFLSNDSASPKPAKQAHASGAKVKPVAKAPATPKFDFYTLLPEMEVAVSEPAPAKPAPAGATSHASEPEIKLPAPFSSNKYRLQLASFKRFDEADNLKAKLALNGHQVEIHSVKLTNGQVWYRVYTPFLPTREEALTLQKELQGQAISSMLLKDREG